VHCNVIGKGGVYMNLMVVFFISLSTAFLCGAEKQATGLLITPHVYVDSERWLKHVEDNSNDFREYAVSLENKPFIQKALQPFLNDVLDNSYGQPQVIIVNMLKNCIETRSVNFTDKLLDRELAVMPEGSMMFIGLLCAVQFYKFINLFQLQVGEYIQRYYEEEAPSAFFRQQKQDVLVGMGPFKETFYQDLFSQASFVFNNSKAANIVDLTKRFDLEINNLSYDSTYNTTMVGLFDRYLYLLNNLFIQDKRKAKL
jgi:hypothetical protein